MDRQRFLETLTADSDRLARAAASNLGARVPCCEGWTVRDAVEHVAEVYEHKIAAIAGRGARPEPWQREWPVDRDPLEWFADARARLLETLTRTDPSAPSWTWWPADQTVGFWVRRMAQETAVHRVDVEAATGAGTPLDPELAVDGIDELLVVMLAGDWTTLPQPDLTGTVAVATGDDAWAIVMSRDEVSVDRGGAPAEAVVSGEPSSLLLWLWGRAPDAAVSIDGDRDVAHRFRKRLALATQ